MSILNIEHVSKIYGTKETKVNAINDVSLKIEKGEFVAIIGPSGSGKSTLLHMIGGVDKPSNGKVLLNGIDVYSLKDAQQAEFRRSNVSIIYQFYNLIPVLNVEENIILPLKLGNRNINYKILDELIDKLGLTNKRKCFPNELSRRSTTKSCHSEEVCSKILHYC